MTIRNVRSYQTRGLIPAPERRGRRSVYSEEHLQRLRDIRSARARGATLSLIWTHLSGGGSLNDDLTAQWLPQDPASSDPPPRRRAMAPIEQALYESRLAPEHRETILDALIDAGVLTRRGGAVLAERDLTDRLSPVGAIEIDRLLHLLGVAIDAARSIRSALDEALKPAEEDDRARHELLEAVGRVLNHELSG